MTVGARIREVRDLLRMKRPALAKLAGVPYPTLAGLEGGDQASSTQLPAIAHALGVNAFWLQTGEGPKWLSDSPNRVSDEPMAYGGPASQSVTLDPEILYEALTLLLYDETQAGAYTPRAQARRLADLYGWVASEGGRLSPASNRTFEDQVASRRTGATEDERKGSARRGRARSA